MEIKQLKYFLAIADERQITSAARRLHIAQPPLSQQLKLLEEELGVKLVERGPRHIQLTDAGKMLHARAKQIIELSNSTISEINDFNKGLIGTLSIGTVSSSGPALLNGRISEFHKIHPGVKFEIHEGNTFVILDLLEKGIIEIGVIRTPFKTYNLNCKYVDLEPMIAVFTDQYNFDTKNNFISISELENKPLILYRRFELLIKETCLESGFEPEIFCKNDDARTTLLWANAGLGIGIIPKSAFQLSANNNLLYKEIKDEKLKTRIAVVNVKGRYISSLAEKFIDCFN